MASLIQRVQDILLRPKQTWPVIAAEPGDSATLYSGYIAPLAAIPVIAGFIGMTLIGIGFGVTVHVPIFTGLIQGLVSYVLSLVIVFVIALLVDVLAPTFGGTRSQINALKVVGYASTAGFVGGIFNLLPALSIVGLLFALYGIYLLYSGLPVLMRCPPDKAVPYTAVVVVCGIVAVLVLGAVTALFTGTGMRMGGGVAAAPATDGDVTIKTPQGQVKFDGTKMADMTNRIATLLTDGVVVEADSPYVDRPALQGIVAHVDFAKIEALKRAAK